jgi:hypothetical protein
VNIGEPKRTFFIEPLRQAVPQAGRQEVGVTDDSAVAELLRPAELERAAHAAEKVASSD